MLPFWKVVIPIEMVKLQAVVRNCQTKRVDLQVDKVELRFERCAL